MQAIPQCGFRAVNFCGSISHPSASRGGLDYWIGDHYHSLANCYYEILDVNLHTIWERVRCGKLVMREANLLFQVTEAMNVALLQSTTILQKILVNAGAFGNDRLYGRRMAQWLLSKRGAPESWQTLAQLITWWLEADRNSILGILIN